MSCIKKCELLDLETELKEHYTYEQACWIAWQHWKALDSQQTEFLNDPEKNNEYTAITCLIVTLHRLLTSAVASAYGKTNLDEVTSNIIDMCVVEDFPINAQAYTS